MIYIITHKKFQPYFLDKEHYKVLHVGDNNSAKEYLNDSEGDNISSKNPHFCELTGLYWIWKNGKEKSNEITGLVHYRRYFTTRYYDFIYTYLDKKPKVLSYKKIQNKLKKHDILLPVPETIYRTVKQSYIDVHNEEDLILTRQTISEIYPEYVKDFDKVMNSHKYYYANMMLCSKKRLDEYATWLFAILFNLESKIDINKYHDPYQKRVFGFLSERLLQVWVVHNNLSVAQFPVFNTEEKRLTIFKKNKNRICNLLLRLRYKNDKK